METLKSIMTVTLGPMNLDTHFVRLRQTAPARVSWITTIAILVFVQLILSILNHYICHPLSWRDYLTMPITMGNPVCNAIAKMEMDITIQYVQLWTETSAVKWILGESLTFGRASSTLRSPSATPSAKGKGKDQSEKNG